MPDELGSVLGEARERLRNCADSVVGALRWRLGLMGPVRPFRDSSDEWSLDGDTWREFSPRLFALLEDSAVRDLTGEILADVAELVSTGRSEPLPYTLWREAWELSAQYPRSAVLIGIAALEVGTKRYIASAAPDTEWLVRELQSPPLSDLLTIYIPKLGARSTYRGRVAAPPKEYRRAIREGIEIRNRIAHSEANDVKVDSVRPILRLIWRVLRLLDFYAGHAWVLENLSVKACFDEALAEAGVISGDYPIELTDPSIQSITRKVISPRSRAVPRPGRGNRRR